MIMHLFFDSDRRIKLLVLLLSILNFYFFGCSKSQTVKKADIPPFRIINTTIAKKLQPSNNLALSVEKTDHFTLKDRYVISSVQFAHLTGEHKIRWQWLTPEGMIFHCTKDHILKAGKGAYVPEGIAHNKIDLFESNAFGHPGDWKIEIYLDDMLAGSEKFTLQKDISGIAFGDYHALVIGNNNYQQLPDLKTAEHDAKAVAKILKQKYGFTVDLKVNATREDILLALENLRENLSDNDSLLIYYAGHGIFDEAEDMGYWQPVNAKKKSRLNWISSAMITAGIRAIRAKHVLIVSDSCYGGALSRTYRGIGIRNDASAIRDPLQYYQRIISHKARSVISSGGLEPVLDNQDDQQHSVFASAFMNVLENNDSILIGTELFSKIIHPVKTNARQTPRYGDIQDAGHDGGEFVFVRKQ